MTWDERIDGYASRVARGWSIPGYEPDDLRQEARLAAWRASMPGGTFDAQRGTLGGHVHACISGHLQNCARTARAQRRTPLRPNDSLERLVPAGRGGGDLQPLHELVADRRPSTADVAEHRDTVRRLASAVPLLPAKQRDAIQARLNGERMSNARWTALERAKNTLRGVA